MACIFCAIVAGSAPAFVVQEDAHALAILDQNPAADGHALVISKLHAVDIFDISADAFADVARAVHAVASRIEERLRPDGITLFQANKRAGWQDVLHLHVHVVPRWHSDSLIRPWQLAGAGRPDLSEVAQRLGAEHRQ